MSTHAVGSLNQGGRQCYQAFLVWKTFWQVKIITRFRNFLSDFLASMSDTCQRNFSKRVKKVKKVISHLMIFYVSVHSHAANIYTWNSGLFPSKGFNCLLPPFALKYCHALKELWNTHKAQNSANNSFATGPRQVKHLGWLAEGWTHCGPWHWSEKVCIEPFTTKFLTLWDSKTRRKG